MVDRKHLCLRIVKQLEKNSFQLQRLGTLRIENPLDGNNLRPYCLAYEPRARRYVVLLFPQKIAGGVGRACEQAAVTA
jgi:hypothetical protein